jgi:hypothetical protein
VEQLGMPEAVKRTKFFDQNFSLFKKEMDLMKAHMEMDETVTISKERYLDLLQKEIDREIGWWPPDNA